MQSFILQVTEDGHIPSSCQEWTSITILHMVPFKNQITCFLNAGFFASSLQRWEIFEVGFGTGLNALLTAMAATQQKRVCNYTAVEMYPLSLEDASRLNYPEILGDTSLFQKIHEVSWNEPIQINEYFYLNKIHADFTKMELPENQFSVIYFDGIRTW